MYFVLDGDLAKRNFEERLRQAEHERLCQQFLARQPKFYARPLQKLGEFLVNLGMRLQVQPQHDVVQVG